MKEWLLFALFLIVGFGMLTAGIIYMNKEKHDKESVKIYRVAAVLGAILAAVGVVYRVMA